MMVSSYLLSPLRYPGGKSRLSSYIENLIKLNNLVNGLYVEPYAGGSAVALYLLFNKIVSNILINDIDKSIYAFWHTVTNAPDELCRLINDTPVTIEQWYRQRYIQNNKDDFSLLELGFSTFFLNRTNRSGIIRGGVIGGLDQSGSYKIDCRFNKKNLIKRIYAIAKLEANIQVTNQDAYDLITKYSSKWPDKTFIYFDPPYYTKGPELYVNYYKHEDHVKLSKAIRNIDKPWIATYDNVPQINEMYKEYRKKIYNLSYTAAKKCKGQEIMIFSNRIKANPIKL